MLLYGDISCHLSCDFYATAFFHTTIMQHMNTPACPPHPSMSNVIFLLVQTNCPLGCLPVVNAVIIGVILEDNSYEALPAALPVQTRSQACSLTCLSVSSLLSSCLIPLSGL